MKECSTEDGWGGPLYVILPFGSPIAYLMGRKKTGYNQVQQ